MQTPSPEPILRHAYGFWASAILATALKHDLFTQLETGPTDVAGLATRASISQRGTQALLDALLGMSLVEKVGADRYRNSASASAYLVRGRPDYLGGYSQMIFSTWRDWEHLPEVVAGGKPLHKHENAKVDNKFWEDLVPALAPLGFPPARAAAERLGIANGAPFRMLDIAGGAGPYSVIWLQLNPAGQSTQLELPNVNQIAKRYVAGFGVADRFLTIDGDMEVIDLGEGVYDYVIYSNIAHGLSAARNTAMFRKIRRALKPGGTLVISSLIPNEDRTGHPLLLMFATNLLLNSEEGGTHVGGEYEAWLRDAGFQDICFEPHELLPFTLVYAR